MSIHKLYKLEMVRKRILKIKKKKNIPTITNHLGVENYFKMDVQFSRYLPKIVKITNLLNYSLLYL